MCAPFGLDRSTRRPTETVITSLGGFALPKSLRFVVVISRVTLSHPMRKSIAVLHEGCREGTQVPQALREILAACLQSVPKPSALGYDRLPVDRRVFGLDTFCEALNRDARKLRVRAARDAGLSRLRKTGASKRRQYAK